MGWPTHIVAAGGYVEDGKGNIPIIKTHNRGWDTPGGQIEVGENIEEGVIEGEPTTSNETSEVKWVHVLCEKPMSFTLQEAADMVKASRKADKILTIGFQPRFDFMRRKVDGIIGSGALGHVYYIQSGGGRRRGIPFGTFVDKSKAGYGCLGDTLWLGTKGAIKIKDTQVMYYTDLNGQHIDSVLHSNVEFDGYLCDAELERPGDMWEGKMRSFVDAILTGGPAPVPGEEIIYNQAICDGIYRSSQLGREVEIVIPEF